MLHGKAFSGILSQKSELHKIINSKVGEEMKLRRRGEMHARIGERGGQQHADNTYMQ